MKYVIGNWKSHKNEHEAHEWIEAFQQHDLEALYGKVTVVICPPYPLIPTIRRAFESFNHIHAGAQDLSLYDEGAYTGEVSAHSLDGFATHVLIGHSERRSLFGESDQDVQSKVMRAKERDIEPIALVRGTGDTVPSGARFVAYEPVEAIGTGHAADVESIVQAKHSLNLPHNSVFIYGGSVQAANVRTYIDHPDIDGVLPGTASLDPHEFYAIASECAKATG